MQAEQVEGVDGQVAEADTGQQRRTHSAGRIPGLESRLAKLAGPLDVQVLTWWVLTRISLLVVSVSGPALFAPNGDVPGLLERWFRWDFFHFDQIAVNGYFDPSWQTDVEAFFPGFPILLAIAHVVGIPTLVTGLLISFVAGGVAALALARLAESEWGRGAGEKAALAWMIAPPAVFLAAPYTESLFLGLAIPAWLAARQGRWAIAGGLAAGACSVRVSGVFLLVALGVEFVTSKHRGEWKNGAWLGLGGVPLLAYMAYLWAHTGDPLRWYHAQADGWYRGFTPPWEALLNTVRAATGQGFSAKPADMPNWEWMFRAELIAMLLGLVVTVVLLVVRRWSEATWVGLQVLAFSTSYWFFSVPRATLLWFPLWMGVGALAVSRPWTWRAYAVISAPLCGVWATAYFLSKWSG